jgi:hypothetical protein
MQRPQNAPQKANQSKSANPSGAGAWFGLTLIPATLNPDQKTDGQRDSQSLKELYRFHRPQLERHGSRRVDRHQFDVLAQA